MVLLRTARHPAAEPLLAAGARPLDHCYEAADSFGDVYMALVEEVVAAATIHGSVAYGVPGSPVVLERSVAALRIDPRVAVRLVPGMSFADLAFDRLGVDPVSSAVRLVDAERFARDAAGDAGPLLLGHCWNRGILSEVKLAVEAPPSEPVTILHHLGLPDEQLVEAAWEDLDRTLEPDHLTCCYLPRLADPPLAEVARLGEVVAVLRERCPWDREQTHQSLVRHLVEEAYEVIESIEELGAPASEAAPAVDADRGVHLEEELGDLLVQVLFHSRLAAEEGMFDLAGVARTCTEKLVRRHPHVFGDVTGVTTAGAVEGRWEQIKKQEKGRSSLTEGIPSSLPALMLAAKLERKLGSVGLGWPATGTAASTLPALLEAAVAGDEEALGDLLLALARISAHRRGDPEEALRRAAGTLRRRFVLAEQLAEAAGSDLADAGDEARRDAWQGARPG